MLPSPSPPLFNVTHLAREIFTILSFKRHTHCSRFWCCFFSRINKCSQLSNDSRHRSDTLGVWIIVRKFFFWFRKETLWEILSMDDSHSTITSFWRKKSRNYFKLPTWCAMQFNWRTKYSQMAETMDATGKIEKAQRKDKIWAENVCLVSSLFHWNKVFMPNAEWH